MRAPRDGLGAHDEGVEEVPAVFAGCREIAAYYAELLGAGEAAEALGHLLPESDHADVAFGAVVVGGDAEVGDEAQVVVAR